MVIQDSEVSQTANKVEETNLLIHKKVRFYNKLGLGVLFGVISKKLQILQ